MSQEAEPHSVPRHVGIIMDGNRRWARERNLPTLRGHLQGQRVLHDLSRHIFEQGVEYLTVYAFSSENWRRSSEEVGYLMKQVTVALRKYIQELVTDGVRLRFLGSRENLQPSVLKAIETAEAKTAHSTLRTLAICFNYGGQLEVADSVRQLINSGVAAEDITPEQITDNLYAPDIPPVDLIIRTGGEQRLSNFMLWRSTYSELMFTDTYWPDFGPKEFDQMLAEYATRQRRFGK